MTQFVFNQKGRKTAVLVPIREWEDLQAKLQKDNILQGVKEGYQEMVEMEQKGTKGKSRQQVIIELSAALNED